MDRFQGKMGNDMATEHDHTQDGSTITFTEAARQKLLEILDSQGLRGRGAIRVAIQGRGAGGFEYAMAMEEDGEQAPDDTVLDEGDFKVFVDAESLPNLRGATVDYVDQLMGGGF